MLPGGDKTHYTRYAQHAAQNLSDDVPMFGIVDISYKRFWPPQHTWPGRRWLRGFDFFDFDLFTRTRHGQVPVSGHSPEEQKRRVKPEKRGSLTTLNDLVASSTIAYRTSTYLFVSTPCENVIELVRRSYRANNGAISSFARRLLLCIQACKSGRL